MKSLLAIAMLCMSAAMLSSCGKGASATKQPPRETVGVVTVQPQTVPLTSSFPGRLSAYRSADVRARVAGVLLKRAYQGGNVVKAGQLLFKIDPAPYEAALNNAQAQLAQAQATYTNDRVNAQRARKLAPKGYISKTDLDNALASERTARAAVKAAKAKVQTAQINLGYTKVTSPITGRAGEEQVTEGALVGQGSATLLTTVRQINPLYANFAISIGQFNELQQAARSGAITLSQPGKAQVQVSLPNGTPYPQHGVVDFASPSVDPSTGAVKLRAVVPNPQFDLLPGSYVNLKVTLGERRGAFLVPQAAIQRDSDGNYVFLVGNDSKVARENVATAGTDGVERVVTSGLAANDKVIVSGIQTIAPGQVVKAEPWQPPTPEVTSSPVSSASTAPAHGS
jgi:membrane fusion protein (multidrug efflux system)